MENKKVDILSKIEILKSLDEDIREREKIDLSSAYSQINRKINRRSRKNKVMMYLNRVAVILLIPLLTATIFLYKDHTEIPHSSLIEVKAAPGAVIRTELPDRSEVWLNSGSVLRYPSVFSPGRRRVELSGEAYFRVEADPSDLFEVSIPSGPKVIAKGTSFNVYAYPDDNVYEMVLEKGLIDIIHADKQFSLKPTEIAYWNVSAENLSKSRINVGEKTGWKEGLLIFRNTPLDEVFKKLSRRYNVDIVVHKTGSTDYGIRATFSSETITQIFDVLKLAAPLKWTIREVHQNNDLSYSRSQIDVWIE